MFISYSKEFKLGSLGQIVKSSITNGVVIYFLLLHNKWKAHGKTKKLVKEVQCKDYLIKEQHWSPTKSNVRQGMVNELSYNVIV